MAEQLKLTPDPNQPAPDVNRAIGTPIPIGPEFDRVCEIHGSSVIERMAYSPKKRLLRVWFQNKTCWEYEGVWPGDFAAIISSYSVGQTFNARIRDRFEARRISEIVDKQVPARKAQVGHQH